jgi:histidine ammonia-lyase
MANGYGFDMAKPFAISHTTGFGSLHNNVISREGTALMQQNLIRSHAVGFGEPISKELVRCMLLL